MRTEPKLEKLPLDTIEVDEANARKDASDEGLDELARSISSIGLQQPVVVYRKKGKHHLIIGQRRYLACKRLGCDRILALIVPVKDETEAAIRSLSENVHRLDLGYTDKMRAADALLKKLGTIPKVADALGVHPQTVRNWLGWAGVPEGLKRMAEDGRISFSTAAHIAKNIPDEPQALQIAEKVRETPSSKRQRAIIETAGQNPGVPADEVVRLVHEKEFSILTVNLTRRLASALDTACDHYKADRSDIAVEAVEEWLTRRHFLR